MNRSKYFSTTIHHRINAASFAQDSNYTMRLWFIKQLREQGSETYPAANRVINRPRQSRDIKHYWKRHSLYAWDHKDNEIRTHEAFKIFKSSKKLTRTMQKEAYKRSLPVSGI